MKLDKFSALKNKFEVSSFEKNYFSLDKTLYYFSFLGNIFLILFSFFFIKNVSNSIPILFPGQSLFFSVFIIVFMTGYELFKRFAFEQFVTSVLKLKKFTFSLLLGALVCLGLICGSFYLGLNGAHRLVDQSDAIVEKTDSTVQQFSDSINTYYGNKITLIQKQIDLTYSSKEGELLTSKDKRNIKNFEQQIKDLETERDNKIEKVEEKNLNKDKNKIDKVKENSFAFTILTFFLELIILIGVGFNSYYQLTSYQDMKMLLNTPKFKQLDNNIKLIKIYYQNGRKKEGDILIPITQFKSLVALQKLNISQKEINDFVNLCNELEITKKENAKRKVYNMPYEKAKHIIETQEII